MHRRHVLSSLVLISTILTACVEDSPIVSGEIRLPGGKAHPLSERQVALLNSWIDAHRSGWSDLVLATPPQEDLSVVVHRQNGESGSLSFYSQPGWRGALMYRGTSPKQNKQGGFPAEQVSFLRDQLSLAQ
jgi:hypothetical protein